MDSLAPDEDDPLRDILSDIGEVPTVEDMIGNIWYASSSFFKPHKPQGSVQLSLRRFKLTFW